MINHDLNAKLIKNKLNIIHSNNPQNLSNPQLLNVDSLRGSTDNHKASKNNFKDVLENFGSRPSDALSRRRMAKGRIKLFEIDL